MGFGSILKAIGKNLPVVGSVVGAGLDLLGNKSAGDAAKQRLEQENKNAAAEFANRQQILQQLKDRGIDIYGPQTTSQAFNQAGTSGSTMSGRTVSDQSFRQNPFITAEYKPMQERLNALIQGRLGQATTVGEAEKAAQLRNINASTAGAMQAVRNLAGRGISAAQLGAAATPVQMARAGSIANYMATLPDIERQRRNEDLGLAAGAIGQFGTGQEGVSHGVTTMNQNQTGFSNMGGTSSMTAPPNYAEIMALTSPNPQVSTNTGFNPYLQAGKDLTGALTDYFAKKSAGAPSTATPMTLPQGRNVPYLPSGSSQ